MSKNIDFNGGSATIFTPEDKKKDGSRWKEVTVCLNFHGRTTWLTRETFHLISELLENNEFSSVVMGNA